MTWGAVAGAAVSVVGSALTSDSGPKRPKWRPYDTENLWGTSSIDRKSKQINQNLSGFAQGVAGDLQSQVAASLASPTWDMGQSLAQQGVIGTRNDYNQLQNYQGLDPNVMNNVNAMQMRGAQGLTRSFGAMQNPYAQQQMQLGMGFMGAQAGNYDSVMQNRLGLLRQQAQPFEDRAQNSLTSKLFSMGQLGPNSTAGNRNIEAFGQGLAQADTGRQLDAMGFAQGLYNQDQQYALAQQGMGANMFGAGVGNYNAQALNSANVAGAMGNYGQGMFDTAANMNNFGYNRAQDRIKASMGLFGFGNTVQTSGQNNAAVGINMLSGITEEQQRQLNNQLEVTRTAMNRGAVPGQAAPLAQQAAGGALMGLGGEMKDMDFSNMFGGSGGGGGAIGGSLGSNNFGGGDWSSFGGGLGAGFGG